MDTFDIIRLGWPYVGLGGAIVIILLLFFGNTFRSEGTSSKWFDPVWLSWAMVAAYLLHVCEEYGLHITDGQFGLITSFRQMGVDAKFGGIPEYFFPYVNIGLTWIALPIAAVIARRNPIVGLGGVGFLLLNGLTHIGGSFVLGQSLADNYGVFTGVLVFIPLAIWIWYACSKKHLLPKKGLGIAFLSGVIAHLLLFSCYVVNLLLGHTAAAIWVPFVVFSPLWMAWLLCKILKVN